MSLLFVFLASGFAALSSLLFRKNTEISKENGSPTTYLMIFYFCSLILSCFIYPEIWEGRVNLIILAIGMLVGVLSSTLMLLTSKALQRGPAGLTFAFQNASAIFPGLLLFLFIGSDFGFHCSPTQLVGMFLVLVGLFVGSKSQFKTTDVTQVNASLPWLKYAVACFLLQVLALTFIQGRCLLFNHDFTNHFLLSDFTLTEASDVWFMPGQFGASFLMQVGIFFKERGRIQSSGVLYGSLGGIANFGSTLLLLLATKMALPLEKSILFPCFAVAAMVLCNIWANRLYEERFNLRTNLLCAIGIFMAVVN